MPADVTIPRLGWSMEEGVFVRWLKRAGEWVNKGDQLFLLESEKATQEIESLDEGTLHIAVDAPQPGDVVKVGQVIARLLAANESAPTETPPAGRQSTEAAASQPPAAGPAARRLARRMNVALDQMSGSGRGGRVTADDIHAAAARREATTSQPAPGGIAARLSVTENAASDVAASDRRIPVSPRARRLARELGIETAGIAGSGRNGRVRERDVRLALTDRPAPESTADAATERARKTRRTIARRMVNSHQSTAPVTLTTTVDATNLVSLRRQFQAAAATTGDAVPSFTDLLIKLLAKALEQHPDLNARWEGEAVVRCSEIHVGVAVDTEAGLLVPVVRDVLTRGIRDIATCTRELAARAKAGQLTTADLQGGTITVTNLGVYGIDAFTPIINPPEAAILGVGAIRRVPVFVEGDRVEAREQLVLSLTFDHRIVDGAPAARFLQSLRVGIENPAVWLTT